MSEHSNGDTMEEEEVLIDLIAYNNVTTPRVHLLYSDGGDRRVTEIPLDLTTSRVLFINYNKKHCYKLSSTKVAV